MSPAPFSLLEGGSLAISPRHRRQRRRSLLWSLLIQVGLVVVMVAALQLGPPVPLTPAAPDLTYLVEEPPPLVVSAPVRARIAPPRRKPVLAAPRRVKTPPPPRPQPVATPAFSAPIAPAARVAAPVFVRPRSAPSPALAPTVQLGRFGDPAGSDPPPASRLPQTLPQLGQFGRASTPAPVLPSSAGIAVQASGFGAPGAGPASASSAGESVVRGSGFGAPATLAGADPAPPPALRLHAFAAPQLAAPGPTSPATPQVPDFEPAQILSWPRPAYTAAAAAQKIEGEVTLRVRLGADGGVEVLRVVQGLGYGLEQSAMAAVRAVRFRPARRHGQAVDSIVLLHIRFQLAY